MIVFDGHNDTLTNLYNYPFDENGNQRSFFTEGATGHIDLPRARRGSFGGGFFAIFTNAPEESPERDPLFGLEITEDGSTVSERSPIDQEYAAEFSDAVMGLAYGLEAESGGQIRIVRNYKELERCLRNKVMAMVLHLEGAEAIREDLDNLGTFYHHGVRSIGLVWSRPNAFGHGVPFRFPGTPDTGPGLTQSGKALIRACNSLGIMVDLAHLNERGFWDVAKITNAPLVVTHADVHAICPSTRNLTDEQIDAIGQSGGVIGINFEAMNTHPESSIETDVPLTQIIQHIDYVAERIGIDHVAFGSDFDGAELPLELSDVTGLPRLIGTLKQCGYDEAAIEKIAYKNWLRMLRATWKD